jgi:hypothetical protein
MLSTHFAFSLYAFVAQLFGQTTSLKWLGRHLKTHDIMAAEISNNATT